MDTSGSLIIHSLLTTDRGSYMCQVSNDVGQAKHQFQVDVYGKVTKDSSIGLFMFFHLEPPSFVDTALDIELNVNVSQTVLLPCPVTGHPSPTVVWFRQNRPIHGQCIDQSRKVSAPRISFSRRARDQQSFASKRFFGNPTCSINRERSFSLHSHESGW